MTDNENIPPSKRARAANYTHQEKTVLLNIILKYKDIVESKKTDAISWREKENAWKRIADNFNSVSPTGLYRPVASLKKAYENIKKNTRKGAADEKASIRCTGGGKGHFNNDPVLDLALEVINPKTIHGLENHFDSDRQQAQSQSIADNLMERIEEAHDTEIETLVIQVKEDDENYSGVNWGDYTVKNLRQQINPRLIPKTKAYETEPSEYLQQSGSTSTPSQKKLISKESERMSWSARRRPITATLPSSDISKKYNQLADLKIELVQKELEHFHTQMKVKEERDAAEFELKKKSLELDIKIEQAILEKITSTSNPLEFFSLQK